MRWLAMRRILEVKCSQPNSQWYGLRFKHLGHRTYAIRNNGEQPKMYAEQRGNNGEQRKMYAEQRDNNGDQIPFESDSIKKRVRQILTNLEHVRESLFALSDDIWLNIDHNDPDALNEGVTFKRVYNEKMIGFNQQASGLSDLIQHFTHVSLETPISAHSGRNGVAENERIIRELDRDTPHTLSEDMSYKRPYGFVLQGQAYKDIATWQRVYKLTCFQLARTHPNLFAALDTHPDFISRRGNKDFSRNPEELRMPLELSHGMYAEANLSANNIRDRVKKLLQAFGIGQSECVIYLREDRDAEEFVL